MKFTRFSSSMILSISLAATALALPPSPVSPGRYNTLWNDSPFTTKPVIVGETIINPFEDYALGGVTPLSGGAYMVTLFNKKKPEERVPIPGNNLGFKVVQVHQGTKGPLSTTVTISNGVKTGEVSFDEKLLVVKPPVAAKPQPGQPAPNGQPVPNPNPAIVAPVPQPVPQPGVPGGQRPPRPRIVPVPPTR